MKKNLARKGILDMPAYIPGKPIEEVERELGLTDVIKMASNECPIGTSPKAIEAMKNELDKIWMYPEKTSPDVQKLIAEKNGIDPDCIYIGNGGDHCINLLCEAFLNEGEELITADPSFITYELSVDIMGGKMVFVPLKDFKYDLDGMLAAVTDKTKFIVICNPNNPTGIIATKEEMDAFMAKVPDDVIVVIDEAYFEFIDAPEYPSGLDYVKQGKNVIVLRSFSKIYGLAGLRIGYLMTTPELIDPLMRVMPPFPVNRVAQAGAVAAMKDEEFAGEYIRINREGREYLHQEFDRLGMKYTNSYGNYVFVDTGLPANDINDRLLRKGVITRSGSPWGYTTYLRPTIGTRSDNERFIRALEEAVEEYKEEN